MRQPNGCSTPAPRSSAAKQWFEQLAQKKKKLVTGLLAGAYGGQEPSLALPCSNLRSFRSKCAVKESICDIVRDTGMGVHYRGTALLPCERGGGNGGTSALT